MVLARSPCCNTGVCWSLSAGDKTLCSSCPAQHLCLAPSDSCSAVSSTPCGTCAGAVLSALAPLFGSGPPAGLTAPSVNSSCIADNDSEGIQITCGTDPSGTTFRVTGLWGPLQLLQPAGQPQAG